jgi:hypothetical protein
MEAADVRFAPKKFLTSAKELISIVPVRGFVKRAGLPDGLFSNQTPKFGKILEGLEMENVGIFMTVWKILRPFGIMYGCLL